MKIDMLIAFSGANLSPKNLASKFDAAAHAADFSQQLQLAALKSRQPEADIEATLASFIAAQQTDAPALRNPALSQFSPTGGHTIEADDRLIDEELPVATDLVAFASQTMVEQAVAPTPLTQQTEAPTRTGDQPLTHGIKQPQDASLAATAKAASVTTVPTNSNPTATATAMESPAPVRELVTQNPGATTASSLVADAASSTDKLKANTAPTAIEPGAATVANSASASLAKATPVTATLSTPVASPQWGQEFSQQMLRLTQHGSQRVSLQLNPAELGPLTIDIKLNDQQAQLQLVSANAQVRQVLEFAIPQLREALSEQGINLSQANVGEQQLKEQDSRRSAENRPAQPTTSDGEIVDESTGVAGSVDGHSALGAVNLYV